MSNEIYLKKVKDILNQLKDKQNTIKDMNYDLNSKIIYFEALRNSLNEDQNIEPSKIEKLLKDNEAEIKELLSI